MPRGPEIVDVGADDPRAAKVVARYWDEVCALAGTMAPWPDGSGAADYAPPRGVFCLVQVDGEVVGCGGVREVRLPEGKRAAEIKRLWVAPESRGTGLGRLLLNHLHAKAVELGYPRAVLDTNDALVAARRLYDAAGYAVTDAYNNNPNATTWMAREL